MAGLSYEYQMADNHYMRNGTGYYRYNTLADFLNGGTPEEMADVLWVLICLANQTGVDLTEELIKSIEKKTHRDALRHIENPKLKA